MFELTEQQENLRSRVRQFADSELAPRVFKLDEKGEFPGDIVRELAALGIIGISSAGDLGGAAMGYLAGLVAIEELARVYPSIAFSWKEARRPCTPSRNSARKSRRRSSCRP